MERAVFLDRDGTIIEDVGYPHEHSKIKFLPKVSQSIKLLNKNAFRVIAVKWLVDRTTLNKERFLPHNV